MIETICYIAVIGYCVTSMMLIGSLMVDGIFKRKRKKVRNIRRNQLRNEYFGEEFEAWKKYKEEYGEALNNEDHKFLSDQIIKMCSDLRSVVPLDKNNQILISANEEFYILISKNYPELENPLSTEIEKR